MPIIAVIMANYLYILTLESCIGNEHSCIVKLRRQVNFFFTCGLSSVLIFAILLNLSIYKKIHKIFGLLVLEIFCFFVLFTTQEVPFRAMEAGIDCYFYLCLYNIISYSRIHPTTQIN